MNQEHIRNFCIIAHIDHGKSTLADRLMELTNTVEKRAMKQQLLDKMDLEREKGITIKLAPVRMTYRSSQISSTKYQKSNKAQSTNFQNSNQKRIGLDAGQGNGEVRSEAYNEVRRTSTGADDTAPRHKQQRVTGSASKQDVAPDVFELNLIDTPGHVDFSYEVSRSLQACEGALLVVDASQGVQAQTLANLYLAMEQDLKIIPIINKIDLPAAETDKVSRELTSLLGCGEEDIIKISAKTGDNVAEIPERIVSKIPHPAGDDKQRSRALIFDSYYDDYRGVILYLRVVDGKIPKNSEIKMMATQATGLALDVGSLCPDMKPAGELKTGEIGYIVTNLKSTREAKVGDTVTITGDSATAKLPGYREILPFVYAGFFPSSNDDYQELKDAVEKLALSDSALRFEAENSPVLGFGVRIGFLGLLHMDIVRERLEREYGLELIVTNPSTDYRIKLNSGEELDIKSAAEMPDASKIEEIHEPWIKGEAVVPKEYVGALLQLIVSKRGSQKNLSYVDERLAVIDFEAPLANLLTDFYDQVKSITSGYGSFNYELDGYRAEDLIKLDFYVAGEMVSALSIMVHRSEAEPTGRRIVGKLKEVIPRQNFKVALQAAIGGKFIAREDISAYRKDVTTGLYGGDVSRKKKVLAKQAKGKKRLKKFGKVDIPAEAFTVLLKRD